MSVIKLTIQNAQDAIPKDGRDTVYRDTELKGFSLKVTPAQNKVFFFQYRVGGRRGVTRKIKIGSFPTIKPDEARKIAVQYAAEVARKQDPQERLKREGGLKLKARENSFGKLFEVYDSKQLSQNKSGAEVKQVFEREFLPTLRWSTPDIESRV